MAATTSDDVKRIWVDILNVPDIIDTDNFIELGGDSIAAVLCLTQIRTEMGVEASMTTLLEGQFATFAREVSRLQAERQA